MLKPYQPPVITPFINREYELDRLSKVEQEEAASLIFVYGRRRVGKTALLEKAFAKRRILKFEGLEGRSERQQREAVIRQLARYVNDDLIAQISIRTWEDVFYAIARYVRRGTWTLYFEEVQWLANYKSNFVTELKLFWDNQFSANPKLLMLLCGSSPAFMVQQVVRSRALYNRAVLELPVNAFSLQDARRFLSPSASNEELIESFLTVGGVPPYLRQLTKQSSLFLSLCHESFVQGGFFVGECGRLMVSSLSQDPIYKKIIAYLARHRFAVRAQLERVAGLRSGGASSLYLEELQLCGFIDSYTSFHLKSGRNLRRYCIADPYLQFYFRFIEPIADEIQRGIYNHSPTDALPRQSYQQWLGYSFERYCRSQHRKIATILNFGAVEYRHGPYFRRSGPANEPGMQLDLCFDRADRTLTICEIKYTRAPISVDQAKRFVQKLESIPLPKANRIQLVLISAAGATEAGARFFDRVIGLDELVNA